MTTSLAWGDIQNLVLSNLGRLNDPVVTALLPTWAQVFQLKVQHDRNYWFLKATAERMIDQTSQVYELPPGYKDGLNLYLKFLTGVNGATNNAFQELFPITDQDVVRDYSPVNGSADTINHQQPCDYVLGVNSFTLWPWPDKQYTLRVTYWKDIDAPTPASLPTFSNYWITYFPQLYEEELTMRGFRYLEQWKTKEMWEMDAKETLRKLRAEYNARVMQSESILIPRADVKGNSKQERGNASWTNNYYW